MPEIVRLPRPVDLHVEVGFLDTVDEHSLRKRGRSADTHRDVLLEHVLDRRGRRILDFYDIIRRRSPRYIDRAQPHGIVGRRLSGFRPYAAGRREQYRQRDRDSRRGGDLILHIPAPK